MALLCGGVDPGCRHHARTAKPRCEQQLPCQQIMHSAASGAGSRQCECSAYSSRIRDAAPAAVRQRRCFLATSTRSAHPAAVSISRWRGVS